MKRIISAILLLSMVFCLCGCMYNTKGQDEADFYYSRIDYAYGSSEGAVAAEARDITGHVSDLYYLMTLYLMGPLDEELISPFPSDTKLVSVHLKEDVLTIELSSLDKSMSDTEFSLACACLTMTCLDICDASQVTILSGERTVTMDAGSLLLYDDTIDDETAMEDTQ